MIVNNASRLMAPCEGGEDWLGSSGGALDMVMRDGLSNYTFFSLPSQQRDTPNLSCSVPFTGSSPKSCTGLKLSEVPLRCLWCASLSFDGAEKLLKVFWNSLSSDIGSLLALSLSFTRTSSLPPLWKRLNVWSLSLKFSLGAHLCAKHDVLVQKLLLNHHRFCLLCYSADGFFPKNFESLLPI